MRNLTENLVHITFTIIVLAFCLMVASKGAHAEVTQKDFQTIIRTIGFLQNAPASNSVFAIIYNPEDKGSAQDARELSKMIRDANKSLIPRLVPVSDTSQIKDSQFVFVTNGLQSYHSKLAPALRDYKTLSFTLDRSCIEDKCCAIYINSRNKVEIVINKAATEAAGAEFKPVFLMMVTIL